MLTTNAESGSTDQQQKKRATRSTSGSPVKTMKSEIEGLKKALQAQKKQGEDDSTHAEKSYKQLEEKL